MRNKTFKKIICFFILVLPVIFILNIYFSIPNKIVLTTSNSYSYTLKPFTNISGISSKKAITATANDSPFITVNKKEVTLSSEVVGSYNLSLNLFNKIPIKNISVTVMPETYVVPLGDPIGVKLYTEGLLIVGVSDVTLKDGKTVSPAKESGIREGDRILSINQIPINSSEEFSSIVINSNDIVTLTLIRDDKTFQTKIQPQKSGEDNKYKLGIWVRDSTAGIGTMTFAADGKFAALGHAITDIDTGDIMTVNTGNILSCDIISAKKGERGDPGELLGSFSNENLGEILINSELGIYGVLSNDKVFSENEPIRVASKIEIKQGMAYILADIDGDGVKKYDVEVQKISKNNQINNKGLIIKIIDPTLLDKTGGIVQGMSGAPIIQNNTLIGAVTHVFVNDPTRGYGIFAQNMIEKIYDNFN